MPALAILLSCSGHIYPTIEESEAEIAKYGKQYKTAVNIIESRIGVTGGNKDFNFRVKLRSINSILEKLSYSREEDIIINFLQTKNIVKEEKSFSIVSYTNHADIDKGRVSLNLREFTFDNITDKYVKANLDISGKGKITISGSYTGIPASASPEITLNLREKVSFLMSSDSKFIYLRPIPKVLKLKAMFKIPFLGWDIPWSEEIDLKFSKLVSSMKIPLTINSDIELPIPSDEVESGIIMTPYKLKIKNAGIEGHGNVLEINSDIDLIKQ